MIDKAKKGGDDSYPIVPTAGITNILAFLEDVGYCMREAEGIKPLTAQEIVAFCTGSGYDLSHDEFRIMGSLSNSFVVAVDKYRDDPDAEDPYKEFLMEWNNG